MGQDGGLSNSQLQLLGLVAEGLSTPEIADRLGWKPRKAKYQIDLLRARLGVERKRDLIRVAREMEGT